MLDEAVAPAEARGTREDLERRDNCHCLLATAVDLEGQHAPEGAHLALRDVVPGVRCQTGIVDPGNSGVSLKILSDGQRVRTMDGHARRQGARAAQREPAVEP